MIAALKRAYAAFRGFDDETGSAPMMDGPLRPNALLDAAPVALSLADVDNLTQHHGALLCSSGSQVLRLTPQGTSLTASDARVFEQAVTFVAAGPSDNLAIGLDSRGILMLEGPHAGKTITEVGGQPLRCPTAGLFIDANTLIVANGAEGRTAADWKRDLMERGATGSLWLIDLSALTPTATQRATDLAFPTGLAHAPGGRLHVSEAWRHRILAFETGATSAPQPVLSDLPAYPGRIAPAPDGGFWLALFAPRNQLVEFVLREDDYRRRMIDNVDPNFWIAPALSSGKSFLEPIQGGARKKLNMLKPWSPSWSYGLVAGCGPTMQPLRSFHSRADGAVHGVTSCCEFNERLYVAAKGSGRIVAVDLADVGGRDS
jgi:hypothetical protein